MVWKWRRVPTSAANGHVQIHQSWLCPRVLTNSHVLAGFGVWRERGTIVTHAVGMLSKGTWSFHFGRGCCFLQRYWTFDFDLHSLRFSRCNRPPQVLSGMDDLHDLHPNKGGDFVQRSRGDSPPSGAGQFSHSRNSVVRMHAPEWSTPLKRGRHSSRGQSSGVHVSFREGK